MHYNRNREQILTNEINSSRTVVQSAPKCTIARTREIRSPFRGSERQWSARTLVSYPREIRASELNHA